MDMEQWGTLSTHDHRQPLFLQSLVLFDRIVVPLPTEPIYDITADEIEKLSAELAFLEKHDAAQAYPWDSGAFTEWQSGVIRETLAIGPRDNLFDSRLMIQQMAPSDVIATPVYGARSGYNAATTEIATSAEQILTLELAKRLPVPAAGVPLQDIIDLRYRVSFQSAARGLRKWRTSLLPELMADPAGRGAEAAVRDLDRLIARYQEELRDSRIKKTEACVVSVLALGATLVAGPLGLPGAVAVLAGVVGAGVAIRGSMRPFWKEVRDNDCAAAGVIYEAQKEFDRFKEST